MTFTLSWCNIHHRQSRKRWDPNNYFQKTSNDQRNEGRPFATPGECCGRCRSPRGWQCPEKPQLKTNEVRDELPSTKTKFRLSVCTARFSKIVRRNKWKNSNLWNKYYIPCPQKWSKTDFSNKMLKSYIFAACKMAMHRNRYWMQSLL